jgi:hypothetical protein
MGVTFRIGGAVVVVPSDANPGDDLTVSIGVAPGARHISLSYSEAAEVARIGEVDDLISLSGRASCPPALTAARPGAALITRRVLGRFSSGLAVACDRRGEESGCAKTMRWFVDSMTWALDTFEVPVIWNSG